MKSIEEKLNQYDFDAICENIDKNEKKIEFFIKTLRFGTLGFCIYHLYKKGYKFQAYLLAYFLLNN